MDKTFINEEKWLPIVGYEGLYEVSDWGRIKSIDRIVVYPNGAKRFYKSKIISIQKGNTGYFRIELNKKSKGIKFSIHRLVAQAFIPNLNNYPLVMHKDDNQLNNHVDNLMWGTTQMNVDDRDNKNRQSLGEKRYNSKLTEEKVIEILIKISNGYNNCAILAKEYGVSRATMHSIIKRETWKHVKIKNAIPE